MRALVVTVLYVFNIEEGSAQDFLLGVEKFSGLEHSVALLGLVLYIVHLAASPTSADWRTLP